MSGGSGGSGAIPAHQDGGTVKTALAGNIDYLDPALAYYQSSWQIEYSTCVKLTNYKDEAGDQGRVIYPEAASSLPEISSDGLTYTYTVPPGKFKFNTGEPVTAESFQYALERDIEPEAGRATSARSSWRRSSRAPRTSRASPVSTCPASRWTATS